MWEEWGVVDDGDWHLALKDLQGSTVVHLDKEAPSKVQWPIDAEYAAMGKGGSNSHLKQVAKAMSIFGLRCAAASVGIFVAMILGAELAWRLGPDPEVFAAVHAVMTAADTPICAKSDVDEAQFTKEENFLHLRRLGDSSLQPIFADFWRKGVLCDIEIRVADCSFRAHRLVLAACSDYMRARFYESIDLPDMPAAAFEAVLEHMYTGTCCIHEEMLVAVLEAASRLQYLGLLEVASRAAQEMLLPANCLRIWEVADPWLLWKWSDGGCG
eukprot:symbB.v1.2.007286.t1/scaffold438.1/size205425/14